MAKIQDNNVYLKIGSFVIDATNNKECFVTVKPGGKKNSSQDTTSGVGQGWTQRGRGLNDISFSVTLQPQTATYATMIAQIAQDAIVAFEYGEFGTGVGNPRHVQQMNVETVTSSGKDVQKPVLTYELSLVGADEPTVDMFSGGVYT